MAGQGLQHRPRHLPIGVASELVRGRHPHLLRCSGLTEAADLARRPLCWQARETSSAERAEQDRRPAIEQLHRLRCWVTPDGVGPGTAAATAPASSRCLCPTCLLFLQQHPSFAVAVPPFTQQVGPRAVFVFDVVGIRARALRSSKAQRPT